MGAALIFFLTKSSSELNKITELRSEMEMLLKYVKGEIRRKNVASSLLAESKVNTLPTSNYWEIESSKKPLWLLDDSVSCNFAGRYAMSCNRQSNWHINLDDRMSLKGNELKCLQLNLEGQDSSVHSYQQRKEVGSESLNETLLEVNEPKEEEANKYCGVCPRELERRLHCLLEARKLEWTAELDTEFKYTERKLHDKDTDICWWGETLQVWSQSIEKTSFICSSKRDAVESASSIKTCI